MKAFVIQLVYVILHMLNGLIYKVKLWIEMKPNFVYIHLFFTQNIPAIWGQDLGQTYELACNTCSVAFGN